LPVFAKLVQYCYIASETCASSAVARPGTFGGLSPRSSVPSQGRTRQGQLRLHRRPGMGAGPSSGCHCPLTFRVVSLSSPERCLRDSVHCGTIQSSLIRPSQRRTRTVTPLRSHRIDKPSVQTRNQAAPRPTRYWGFAKPHSATTRPGRPDVRPARGSRQGTESFTAMRDARTMAFRQVTSMRWLISGEAVVTTRGTPFSSSRFFADTVPRPWHVSHRMIVCFSFRRGALG
jgi:hypothetical protein